MGLLANSNAIESGGYNIDRSLRFRSSATARLNRTPASASNRKTWTWSGWVKRGALGSYQQILVSSKLSALEPNRICPSCARTSTRGSPTQIRTSRRTKAQRTL